MKTCKTCRYWGHSRNYAEDSNKKLRSCSAPLMYYGYHIKMHEVEDNGALVEDDEGWGILTGPEFGCVLHADKLVDNIGV